MNEVIRRFLPPCRVCGDKASGLHYGVNTCEACKGFYRRSFARKRHLKCKTQSQQCRIRYGQNNCSFCRYQKCVGLGMSKEAIKIGRYTNQQKADNIREVVELSRSESIDFTESVSSVSPSPSNVSPTSVKHMTSTAPFSSSYVTEAKYTRSPLRNQSICFTPPIGHSSILDILSQPVLHDVHQCIAPNIPAPRQHEEIPIHSSPNWHQTASTNQLPAISAFVENRRNSQCYDVKNINEQINNNVLQNRQMTLGYSDVKQEKLDIFSDLDSHIFPPIVTPNTMSDAWTNSIYMFSPFMFLQEEGDVNQCSFDIGNVAMASKDSHSHWGMGYVGNFDEILSQ